MLRGKFLSMILLMTAFLGVAVWSVWNYDRAFKAVTRYTQLSAWSLAQLELEIQSFQHALDLYRAGATSAQEMNRHFDIAWNRLDVFIHGAEAKPVRDRSGAGVVAERILQLFQQHESDVMTGKASDKGLQAFSVQLHQALADVRDVMVRNFTGPTAIEQRTLLAKTRVQNFLILAVLLLACALMLLQLFREVKRQHYLAWNDALTGLPNRAALLQHLASLAAKRRAGQGEITLCLLDLGHFREVNDSLGYERGDALLKGVADELTRHRQPGMFIARIGSDEFALVIAGKIPAYLRFPFLETVLCRVQRFVFDADPAHRVRAFMGICHQAGATGTPKERLLFADIALESAKRQRAHRYVVFSSKMHEHYQRNRQLSAELNELIHSAPGDQLFLCYQPIIHERGGNVLGAETLLRWRHPTFGFINPFDVISLAEENGMGERLGQWIFARLQHDLSRFPASTLARLELSVNLSGSMFHTRLAEHTVQLMAGGPLRLDQLVLELTETIALDDLPLSKQIFASLRRHSIRVALDDFGTGWSSFSYLRELYFDKLKIDRSFITAIDSDERQSLFVSAITTLSHQLGVQVVAEGVETQAELQVVRRIGVDKVQGYVYSKPLAIDDFLTYCQHWQKINPVTMVRLSG